MHLKIYSGITPQEATDISFKLANNGDNQSLDNLYNIYDANVKIISEEEYIKN